MGIHERFLLSLPVRKQSSNHCSGLQDMVISKIDPHPIGCGSIFIQGFH